MSEINLTPEQIAEYYQIKNADLIGQNERYRAINNDLNAEKEYFREANNELMDRLTKNNREISTLRTRTKNYRKANKDLNKAVRIRDLEIKLREEKIDELTRALFKELKKVQDLEAKNEELLRQVPERPNQTSG